jgi:Tfp pilus assembly protein PilO
MPSSADQPGLVLELDRLARSSGVTLGSITPKEPESGVVVEGATMILVTVVVDGSYREITRFLTGTRRLVTVRRGKLRATGRLFTVQSVELSESSTAGFPHLDGTITLNAYFYDGPIVPPSAPTPVTEPSSGATAQGATP